MMFYYRISNVEHNGIAFSIIYFTSSLVTTPPGLKVMK